jgi:hypothetical protein
MPSTIKYPEFADQSLFMAHNRETRVKSPLHRSNHQQYRSPKEARNSPPVPEKMPQVPISSHLTENKHITSKQPF